MWNEYGLGVQPQSPHSTMSYRLGVAQICGKIPKAWSAWAAVTGGDTSICTSTAYNGCQTPYIYIIWMWDEYGLGVQPQSQHFTMSYRLGVAQISDKIPKAWSAWAAVRGVDTSICTSTAYKGCQTPYIYNMDVRWIWVGSTASITSFHHHISAETCPDLWQNSTSSVNMSGRSVVWTHPYAHPQHIMVVKHLLYI